MPLPKRMAAGKHVDELDTVRSGVCFPPIGLKSTDGGLEAIHEILAKRDGEYR